MPGSFWLSVSVLTAGQPGAFPAALSAPASTVIDHERPLPDVEAIARDVRQVLLFCGLPELPDPPDLHDGEAGAGMVVSDEVTTGGFQLLTGGGRVRVMWSTEPGVNDESGLMEVDHPYHPLVTLERGATAIMERALADLLHKAGFTVMLQPGVRNRVNLAKETDPELIVLAAPEFKAWASG